MLNVLITGTSKGIGKALTQKFLAEGHFVIGTYLSEAPLPDRNSVFYQLDLSSPKSIAKCSEQIVASGKKIDILINNAGVLLDEEETGVVVDLLRKTLEINLIGTIDFAERMIPLLNNGGHVLNISSTAGSLELAGEAKSHYPYHYPAYKISKSALNMYTATLANKMKKYDITVSSVHPGWVKTDIGGAEAEMSPEEAADGIYGVAMSRPETGQFWFKGEKLPW